MGTSRTPQAAAHAPHAPTTHDRLVASRHRPSRAARSHLRVVPDLPPAPTAPRVRAAREAERAARAAAMRRHPSSGGAPLRAVRPAPEPARASGRRPMPARAAGARRPAPVRLTRRGRVVVTLFLASVLVVAGWAVGRTVAAAATTGQAPAASVVARPGDTLWAIALRVRPDADPRVTVGQIMAANRLPSPVIEPGQRVVLPRF